MPRHRSPEVERRFLLCLLPLLERLAGKNMKSWGLFVFSFLKQRLMARIGRLDDLYHRTTTLALVLIGANLACSKKTPIDPSRPP